jgi:protein arginine kinase activator
MCHVRDAAVHLTEVINDEVSKLHLCEHCAKLKGAEMQAHFGLTDLLSSLMDFGAQFDDGMGRGDSDLACSACGMTYQDFQKLGKFGCQECYETFKDELSKLLRKIHGSDRHAGKMPFMGEKVLEEQQALKKLKEELSKLVLMEEFEKAAIMRDRVKELEDKISEE